MTELTTNVPTFRAWIRATSAGWASGVPLIAVLALLGEVFGIGGAQFLVGAGVGLGVGLFQARALRGALDRPVRWLWACAAGVTLPFLVTDTAKAVGVALPYSLHACVAAGGLLAGAWQTVLLRPRFRSTGWWIAASASGWSLAGGTVTVADALQRGSALPRGTWGAVAYLGLIAAGGVILGVVTALPFRWMAPRNSPVVGTTENGTREGSVELR